MSYSDRELVDVIVSDLRSWIDPDGIKRASGEVTMTLNNPTYDHIAGPHVTARVSLEPQPDEALEAFELRLLDRARDLLKRLYDEPLESVREVYRRERDDRNKPDPLADFLAGMEKPAS